MCKKLLLLCLFNSVVWISAGTEITFAVKETSENTVACIQTRKSPHNATVLENENLNLTVKLFNFTNKPFVNYFRCFEVDNEPKTFVRNPKKGSSSTVSSIQVKGDMSGIWKCRILIYKGNERIKPIEYHKINGKNTSYTAIYCYVNVHVRLMETPQIVLVNNMIVPTTQIKDTKLSIDHSIEYKFLDGESVDVACIPENSLLSEESTIYTHSIIFEYDYAEKLDDMFKKARTPNGLGYRYRTTLRTDYHHNSKMICKCDGPKDYTIIEVTFSAQNHLDPCDNIETNGLKSRPLNGISNELGFAEIKQQYLFLEDTEVNWVCNKYYEDCQTTNAIASCEEGISKTTTNKKNLTTPFNFTCDLCYNEKAEKVLGIVNKMSSHFIETTMLQVNLPENNTFLELHKLDLFSPQSWIYYELDENYNFPLNCTIIHTKSPQDILLKYKLNGRETEEKKITFTSNENDLLFECYALEKSDFQDTTPNQKYSITVLFRKKVVPPPTPPSGIDGPTEPTRQNTTGIYIGAFLFGAVIAISVVTVYYIRKLRRIKHISTIQMARRPLPEVPAPSPLEQTQELEYDYTYPAVYSEIQPQPRVSIPGTQNTLYYWL